jgi:4-hydroxy-4-methyl-2-oxoglutarate aldolase
VPVGFRVLERVEPSVSDAFVERLREHDTTDVSDCLFQSGTMVGIRHIWGPVPRICGRAVTVSTPIGGVFMLRVGMEMCRDGDVLVVSARGAKTFAMFGGHVSVALKNRGVAAVIVDGCVRDPDEIREGGLPVFARGVATAAASADGPGEVNVPVACGGVVVSPGDVILADGHGIVAVPRDATSGLLERLGQATARADSWEPDIQAGRIFGLDAARARLAELGCDFP